MNELLKRVTYIETELESLINMMQIALQITKDLKSDVQVLHDQPQEAVETVELPIETVELPVVGTEIIDIPVVDKAMILEAAKTSMMDKKVSKDQIKAVITATGFETLNDITDQEVFKTIYNNIKAF